MSGYDFSPEAREKSRIAGIAARARRIERMESDPEYAEKIRLARVEQRRKRLEKNPNLHKEDRARRLAKDPDYDKKHNAGKWEKIRQDPELYAARQEAVRKHKLKVKYGITPEDFGLMFDEQGGVCGICPRPLEVGSYKTHVDHDHKTGRVRGLLCLQCNTALGKLGEDESIILSMLEYVRKHA